MSSVDDRIVEMKFDNAQFEAGVKQTLKSIESLKTSVDSLDQGTNLTNIAKDVKYLGEQFTPLGVIGQRVIQNLTDSVMGFGSAILSKAIAPLKQFGSAINNYVVKPLTGGGLQTVLEGGFARASTIEQAQFMIEGFAATNTKDAEEISKAWTDLKDDISYAVNDTAYGFDEAAAAAASFTASNVQAGDQMKTSLRAISGVAAMTGASYGDMANIFTTVAGNGRLMGDQLLQLSSRGINAAAILGQQLGKSESEIREMVSKGQIDFNTFAKAMDDAFGEHAKDANKTFSGATANIRAALKKIGADFAAVMISTDDYNKSFETGSYNLINVANNIRMFINGIKTAIEATNGPLQGFTGVFHTISQDVSKAFASMYERTDAAGRKLDEFGYVIDDTGRRVKDANGNFIKSSAQTTKLVPKLENSFNNLYGAIQNVTKFVVGVADSVNSAWKKIFGNDLFGTIEKVTGAIKDLTDKLPKVDSVSDTLASMFGIDIPKAADAVAEATSSAATEVTKQADAINQAYNGVTGNLKDLVRQTIMGDFGNGADRVNALGDSFRQIQDEVDRLYKDFPGLTSNVDILNQALDSVNGTVGPVNNGLEETSQIQQDLSQNTITASEHLTDESKNLDNTAKSASSSQKFFANLRDTMTGLFAAADIVRKVLGYVGQVVSKVVIPVIGGLAEIVLSITGTMGAWFGEIDNHIPSVENFGKKLDGVLGIMKPFTDVLGGAKNALVDFFMALRPGGNPLGSLKNTLDNASASVYNFFNGIKLSNGSSIAQDVQKRFEPVMKFLQKIGTTLKPILDSIVDSINGFIGKIKDSAKLPEDPIAAIYEIITGSFDKLLSFISGIKMPPFMDKISEAFDSAKGSDIIKNFMDVLKDGWAGVTDFFSTMELPEGDTFLDKVKNFFEPVKEFFTDLPEALADLVSNIFGTTDLSDKVSESLGGDSVTQTARNSLGPLGDFLSTVGGTIADGLNTIIGAFDNFASRLDIDYGVIKGVVFDFIAVIGAIKVVQILNSVNKITEGIGGIIGAFTKLSSGGVLGILGLGGPIKEFTNTLKVMQESVKADNLTKIAASIAILVGSLILLGSVNPSVLRQGGLALGALALGLTLMTKFAKGDNLKKLGEGLKSLAVGLVLVAIAARTFASIDWPTLAKGGVVIGVLIFALAGAARVMGGANLSGMTKIAFTLTAFAAGIYILSEAVKEFIDVKPEDVAKGVRAVADLMIMMSVTMAILNETSKGAKSSALNVLAVAASIAILARVVQVFSSMDIESLKQGMIFVGILMAAITGMTALMGKAGANATKAVPALLTLVGAIATLSLLIFAFSKIPIDDLSQGIWVVGSAALALSVSLFMLSKLGPEINKTIPAIAAITIAVGVLSAAVYAMGTMMTGDQALQGVMALAGVMAILGAALVGISAIIGGVPIIAAGLAALSTACLAIGGGVALAGIGIAALAFGIQTLINSVNPEAMQNVVDSLKVLSQLNWESFLSLAGVSVGLILLGVGLLALGAGVALLSTYVDSIPTIMNGLSTMVNTLGTVDGGNFIALGIGMTAVGIGSLVMGAGLLILAAGVAVINAVDVVGTITTLTTALTYLTSVMTTEQSLLLANIGAGAVVLGLGLLILAAGVAVINAANPLTAFAAIASGTALLANIDVWALFGISAAFIVLGAGSLIAGAGLAVLGLGLNVFRGPAAVLSFLTLIDPGQMALLGASFLVLGAGSLIAGAGLLILAAGANLLMGGIGALAILSSMDPAQMALLGAAFLALGAGSAIMGAGLLVLGAGAAVAAPALQALAASLMALYTALMFLGNMIAGAINSVVTSVSNMANDMKTAGGNIVQGLVDGIKSSPIGDIAGFFWDNIVEPFLSLFGIHSPSTVFEGYGENITEGLGNGIQNFDISSVISDLGQSLLDTFNGLDLVGSFTEIGGNLVKGLGSGLSSFISDPIGTLRGLAGDMGLSFDGLPSIFGGKGKDMMSNLTSGISKNGQAATDATALIGSNSLKSISDLDPSFSASGKGIMSNLGSGISGMASSVSGSAGNVASGANSKILSFASKFMGAGKNLASNTGSGISSNAGRASSAAESMANGAKNAVTGMSGAFSGAGRNMASGLAAGIRNGASSAISAARNLATSALRAAKHALGIKSPSREFAKVGMYSDLGFAKGVSKYSNRVIDSMKQMAKQSTYALNSNMGTIPNLVLGIEDTDPVIRPSLDLSRVMQQSKIIDGIFNDQYAIGLSSGIGSVTDYTTARKFDMQNQNGTTNNRNNTYNITLDYKAGDDANKIVNDIAAAIKSRARMEVR